MRSKIFFSLICLIALGSAQALPKNGLIICDGLSHQGVKTTAHIEYFKRSARVSISQGRGSDTRPMKGRIDFYEIGWDESLVITFNFRNSEARIVASRENNASNFEGKLQVPNLEEINITCSIKG